MNRYSVGDLENYRQTFRIGGNEKTLLVVRLLTSIRCAELSSFKSEFFSPKFEATSRPTLERQKGTSSIKVTLLDLLVHILFSF